MGGDRDPWGEVQQVRAQIDCVSVLKSAGIPL
jgi:hypothetical protein